MPKAKLIYKKKPRLNGLVLTAKHLDSASYNAIHALPHGLRALALHALLEAAAACAKKDGPLWYKTAVIGKGKKLKLVYV